LSASTFEFLLCNIALGLVGQVEPSTGGIEQNGSLQRTARRACELDTLSGAISAFRWAGHGLPPNLDLCSKGDGIVEPAGSACQ
jgi:hypothetical protein